MNRRDFPLTAIAPYNIEVQHPDVFLTDLYGLAPELVATLIQFQAGALRKPPMTPRRVLETLAQHVPVFASDVRAHLQDADTLEAALTEMPEEVVES